MEQGNEGSERRGEMIYDREGVEKVYGRGWVGNLASIVIENVGAHE